MSLHGKCPGCGSKLEWPEEFAGKTASCANCGKRFRLPSPAKIVPPRQIPAPEQSDVPPPPPQYPPGEFDWTPNEPKTPKVEVAVDYKHRAAGGAFRIGFGIALGCLTAVAVFSIVGLILLGMLGRAVSESLDDTLKESQREAAESFERDMAQMDQQMKQASEQADRMTESLMGNLYREMATQGEVSKTQGRGFSYKNVTMRSDFGMLKVIGEITNNSGRSYTIANFVVTIYDKNGRLIDTGYAIISNFANGQEKSFDAPFINVDPKQIGKYKIQFENGL